MPAPSGTMDCRRAVKTGFERFDRLNDFSYCRGTQNGETILNDWRPTCQLGRICLKVVSLVSAVPLYDDLEEGRCLL